MVICPARAPDTHTQLAGLRLAFPRPDRRRAFRGRPQRSCRDTAVGGGKTGRATTAFRTEWVRSSLLTSGNGLARNHVQRLPLGQSSRQASPEFRRCYRPRAGVHGSREPSGVCPVCRISVSFRYAFLVHDREELLAHLAGLSLALDFVAIDDAAAIRVRAGAVATSHRPC